MTQTITETEFPAYIRTISRERWETFFELISKIQQASEFGKMSEMELTEDGFLSLPYSLHTPLVTSFIETVYELGLIINYDWAKWEEGSKTLCNPPLNLRNKTETDLCKLLTLIVRADRFNDGFLICNFNDGTVLKILLSLRERIHSLHL